MNPLFEEVHTNVFFVNGYYAVSVGSVVALNTALFEEASLYLAFRVDAGDWLSPRIALQRVPSAFVAEVAKNATGAITPKTVSVGGTIVINEAGEGVGAPTGLRVSSPEGRGPACSGADGVEGPRGPRAYEARLVNKVRRLRRRSRRRRLTRHA